MRRSSLGYLELKLKGRSSLVAQQVNDPTPSLVTAVVRVCSQDEELAHAAAGPTNKQT